MTSQRILKKNSFFTLGNEVSLWKRKRNKKKSNDKTTKTCKIQTPNQMIHYACDSSASIVIFSLNIFFHSTFSPGLHIVICCGKAG